MSKQDLKAILAKLDIIALAESYGFEFKGKGNKLRAIVNLMREEKTSSIDFFIDTQRFYDRGTGRGGDAFDLIAKMENIVATESIIRAKELAGEPNHSYSTKTEAGAKREPIKREVKRADFKRIYGIAQNDLKEVQNVAPFFILSDETNVEKDESIKINNKFKKLFETGTLETVYYKKIETLFKHYIGWSTYWNSPTIVIKNPSGFIVDLVAYRPKDKENNEEIKGMKYHYQNFNDRGESFLYPFQKEMEHIAEREKYVLVGEGLKNALNALLYSVPFISIESTGNTLKISEKFIKKLKEYISKGYGFATIFDGDEAGKEAYLNFLEITGLKAENVLDFDSNQDFVEYLRAK